MERSSRVGVVATQASRRSQVALERWSLGQVEHDLGAGDALDEGDERGAVAFTDDQVAFPVTGLAAVLGLSGRSRIEVNVPRKWDAVWARRPLRGRRRCRRCRNTSAAVTPRWPR